MEETIRFRGDTASIGIKISQNRKPYDLTGCVLTMSVASKENPEFLEDIVQTTVATIDDPLTGEASFVFADTDFNFIGEYFYDIEFINAALKRKTMVKGILIMEADITNETLEAAPVVPPED